MNFWSIIKIIAGIIANLPFDRSASEEQVQQVVREEVNKQVELQGVSVSLNLTPDDIEKIIAHLVGIVLIVIRSRNNMVTQDGE